MAEEKLSRTSEENRAKPVTELARDMGLMHVTMIGIGAMIGAGIFVLTGLAAGVAGPALLLVFLFNGIVTGLTAMSYAELGSCFPEAGGGYLWVKEALPQPNGFLSGWISWFAHAVVCSLYAVAFGAFSVDFLNVAGVDLSKWLSRLFSSSPHVLGTILDEIVLNTICDVALVCRARSKDEEIDRVLIPVSNIKYAILSLKIAEALLKNNKTPIVLFHATARQDVENVEVRYHEELQKLKDEIDPQRYKIVVRKTHKVVEAILAEIQHHDLIIMGAPEEGLVRRALFGDMPV